VHLVSSIFIESPMPPSTSFLSEPRKQDGLAKNGNKIKQTKKPKLKREMLKHLLIFS
jgi:hypothetical protein